MNLLTRLMLRANAYDESKSCIDWVGPRMSMLVPAGAHVWPWLQSFRKFTPRMKLGSFSLDRAMEAVTVPLEGSS